MGDDWKQLYGDFDCEANSVAYWLHMHGLSPTSFIGHNWDFYYDEEESLLRGGLRVPSLVQFLRTAYGLSVTELSFEELPYDELVIIPGNAYWLPYASDYYMVQRLVHYYPARMLANGNVQVWDPIFHHWGVEVRRDIVQRAYGDLDRRALALRKLQARAPEEPMKPYILTRNYEVSYSQALHLFFARISALLDRPGDLKKDLDYTLYFGNLQSILIGRERYFHTFPSPLADGLIHAWRNVSKQYMRLSYLRQRGWEAFSSSITAAVEAEKKYLGGLKSRNQGGLYMNQEQLKEEIITMLQEILETPVEDPDENLGNHGMNSLKAIQLIVELETRYEVEFEDSELLFENFNTINVILSKMKEKLHHLAV